MGLIYWGIPVAFFILLLLVFLRYYRYRFYLLVTTEHISEMDRVPVEGYTDRMYYEPAEEVKFFLRSDFDNNRAVISKISAPYNYEKIEEFTFDKIEQELNNAQSENGCNWNESFKINIDEKFSEGYYNVKLSNDRNDTFNITFLVGSGKKNAEVIVLAPTTTWIAYNAWGGKSLYHNGIDATNVYFGSTQRPNTAVQYYRDEYNHVDVNVGANIVNWFKKNYDATLMPDYFLEKEPERFSNAKLIVLSYHCEYVSPAMYENLKEFVHKNKTSLISLGANQIYWKILWNEDYTRIECRKDLTFFDTKFTPGGMWKHNLKSEAGLLGARYTGLGLQTFAPFKALNSSHWLYNGTGVKDGDLFGLRGINDFPICGDETDKVPSWMKRKVEIIAKGLNCANGTGVDIYDPADSKWDGSGGGEIVYMDLDENAVLSTGAIYSGSGIGSDEVFTAIVKNFSDKCLSKKNSS